MSKLGNTFFAICFVFINTLIFVPSAAMAGTLETYAIPDTGQTKCYDGFRSGASEIVCPSPGEALYGQDAQYGPNLQSFTKLDSAGNALPDDAAELHAMVLDNVTGLTWEVKQDYDTTKNELNLHDANNRYTMQEALDTFIAGLNAAKYGGYDDWRLPNVKELFFLMDHGNASILIDILYFPNTAGRYNEKYWTSTPAANPTTSADSWCVDFWLRSDTDTSSTLYLPNSEEMYVRAVRGESIPLQNIYIDNGDGTVTDTTTGLMWANRYHGDSSYFKNHLSYAENLILYNNGEWTTNDSGVRYDDWHLPSVNELMTLVNPTTATFDPVFVYANNILFPTSTSVYKYGSWSYWYNVSLNPNVIGGEARFPSKNKLAAHIAVRSPDPTYTIGGTVSGLAGSGLVLQNNGDDDLDITASGSFAFATALADGSAYAVTILSQPTSPDQTCTVSNGSGTLSGGNVATVSVACVPENQDITGFAATPSSGAVGGSSTLSATASSGLTVTFGSNTPAICTVVGSTVSYLVVGTCTVTADQAGDASFNPAPQVTLDIDVSRIDQTITNFTAGPSTGVINGSSTLSATGGASGNPVYFGSNTPGVCTVINHTVNYVAAGTCTVTADQAGDREYNFAPQVTLDITVEKVDQIINGLAANPATGIVAGTSALSASASSGLTVSFGSSTPAVCTVAGSTVTYVTEGTCTVTADQAGDAEYNAALQVTLDITVAKADQTITGLTSNPATGVVEGSSALSSTADSGLTVSFGSSTAAVCKVTGTTVNYLAAGTCTVTADQAGDAAYNAATQVTLDISVAKADQTISGLAADPAGGVIGGTSALSVSGTASVARMAQSGQKLPTTKASGIPVTFGSSTLTICTVAGSTVSYLAVGTCTVTADQAGGADYNPAPQLTLDINVTEPPPAIPNVPIPTLSLWGLVAMFLMMLGVGGMVMRRKTRS